MLLCEGSSVTLNVPKSVSLVAPTPDAVLKTLRDKAANQTAYKMNDLHVDASFGVTWGDLRFSRRSFRRMASVIGVPAKFLATESCRGRSAQSRIADIVNERLAGLDDGFTAVVDAGTCTIEGVMSPTYKRLASIDAVQFILDKADMGAHEVARFRLEETRMELDLVSSRTDLLPEQKALLSVGDPLRFGLSIFNSEDADSFVEVLTFIERLRCKNGATMRDAGKAGRIRHVGDAFFQRFASVLGAVTAEAGKVFGRFMPMRSLAISADETESLVNYLSNRFPERVVDRIMDDAYLNVDDTIGELMETKKVEPLRRASDNSLVSVYNVWNGITFQGHEAKSLDQRRKYEAVGGDFVREFSSFISSN